MLQLVRKLVPQKPWSNYAQELPKLGPMVRDPRAASGQRSGSPPAERWRVYSGEGRFDPAKKNALFSKRTTIGLNFRIIGRSQGRESGIESYEICVVWPDGWRLMFHRDPDQSQWPTHPEHHLQFQSPEGKVGAAPPFCDWRPPFAEPEPQRLLEYIVAHIC